MASPGHGPAISGAEAVAVTGWVASRGRPPTAVGHVILASWAFAMGMQSTAVRTLRVEDVISTAATGTVLGFMGDIANGSATGAMRRRLAAVLLSLFVGATAGALLLVHAHIYAPLLPFLVTLAVVATAAVRFAGARRDGRAGAPSE